MVERWVSVYNKKQSVIALDIKRVIRISDRKSVAASVALVNFEEKIQFHVRHYDINEGLGLFALHIYA